MASKPLHLLRPARGLAGLCAVLALFAAGCDETSPEADEPSSDPAPVGGKADAIAGGCLTDEECGAGLACDPGRAMVARWMSERGLE